MSDVEAVAPDFCALMLEGRFMRLSQPLAGQDRC